MLIVCPTCATTYQIQLAALGAAGRSVRCSHCKNTWFATADSAVRARNLFIARNSLLRANRFGPTNYYSL